MAPAYRQAGSPRARGNAGRGVGHTRSWPSPASNHDWLRRVSGGSCRREEASSRRGDLGWGGCNDASCDAQRGAECGRVPAPTPQMASALCGASRKDRGEGGRAGRASSPHPSPLPGGEGMLPGGWLAVRGAACRTMCGGGWILRSLRLTKTGTGRAARATRLSLRGFGQPTWQPGAGWVQRCSLQCAPRVQGAGACRPRRPRLLRRCCVASRNVGPAGAGRAAQAGVWA